MVPQLSVVAAFLLSFALITFLTPVARILNLVDRPGGRKVHNGVIPLVGGIASYASLLIVTLFFVEQTLFVRVFLLGGGLLVLMGAIDDRYDINAKFRLVGQILVAGLFAYGLQLQVGSLGNIFGLGELRLGWLSFPLTLLSIVGAINAFNMLDGLDGLVGGISLVTFAGLAVLFGASGQTDLSILCMAIVGALGGFLVFNLWGSPGGSLAKIFMGDAGSMLLGMAVAVFLVKGSQGPSASFSPVAALWFVLLPITDMLTIMYRRVRSGRSPMTPDRTHIHHLLLRAGLGPMQVLCVLMLAQAVLVLIGVMSARHEISEVLSFVMAVGFVAAFQWLTIPRWRQFKDAKADSGVSSQS